MNSTDTSSSNAGWWCAVVRLMCRTTEDDASNAAWDWAEDAATLKSVCVCVFWCRSHAVLRRMLPYLDVSLQYVGEERGLKKKKNILKNPLKRQFMEKNLKKKQPRGTRILLHLLGNQVFGWSSFFFQTPFVVYPASCLITALTCDCLFASVFFLHTPSPCAPFPPPRSTLQQL